MTGPWKVWPRAADGRCSCPYCTALRTGKLPPIDERPSQWLERMGVAGTGRQSAATRRIFSEDT